MSYLVAIFRLKFDILLIAFKNTSILVILLKLNLTSFFYRKVEIKFSYPFYNKYLSFYANIKFSNPNKKNILIYKKKRRLR